MTCRRTATRRRWRSRSSSPGRTAGSAEGTFHTPNPTGRLSAGFEQVADRPKFFVMDMFPYPSGAGLHVGHPLGYIGTDVTSRFRRMDGDNVLHPMGFDAFGLPAEQYAVQTGQHPRITTEANIEAIRAQLRRLGLDHDDRRSFATIDPGYYKWTQWIFLQIFDSWYDERPGKARRIEELVAELDAGTREPAPGTNPSGPAVGRAGRGRAGGWSSTRTGWPTCTRRRSTGARAWARCCPTRRSPPTAAPSAATSRCSGAR